ncbi:unnamed protein product [Symbiodinium sp. CCMP2592]|nr:unnamed protein product [Symbiodinium sp. CCMP2592]
MCASIECLSVMNGTSSNLKCSALNARRRLRISKVTGRPPPLRDVAILAVHHSSPWNKVYHMGKEKWNRGQPSYGGPGASWHSESWHGKGSGWEKGQNPRRPREPKPEAAQFPTLEMMATTTRKPPTKKPLEEDGQEGSTAGRLDMGKVVQKLLNGVRKAEGRIRRGAEDREALEQKWANFQLELKQSFAKERAKYMELSRKHADDMEEQQKIRDEALSDLQTVILTGTYNKPQSGTVPTDSTVDAEWDKLVGGDPDDEADLSELLTNAIAGGGCLSTATREKMLKLITRHHGRPQPMETPERRRRGPPPATPPRPTRTAREAEQEPMDTNEPTYTGDKVLLDPYQTSPSTRHAGPSPGHVTTRSRSKPRVAVKEQGKTPPPPPTGSLPLSEKLEAVRKEERQKATIVDSDDEDALIAHLKAGDTAGDGEETALANLIVLQGGFFGSSALPYDALGMPADPCDSSLQDERTNFVDLFDVLDWLYGILWDFVNTWIPMLEAGAQAVGNTLRLGLLILCGSLLMTYVPWHRPYASRSGRPALPVVYQLVLVAALWSSAGAAPVWQEPPYWAPPCPRPRTDLELWAAGQLSTREQLARALSSTTGGRVESGGVWPTTHYDRGPPQVRVDPPDPVVEEPPDEWTEEHETGEEEELQSHHISFWVSALHVRPQTLDVGLMFPLSDEKIRDIVEEHLPGLHLPWLTDIVQVSPQPDPDFGSLIYVPAWVQQSEVKAVMIDARQVGKGIFVAYVTSPVNRYLLLSKAEIIFTSTAEIFVGGSGVPMAHTSQIPVDQGCLIQILPAAQAVTWHGELRDRYAHPSRWRPDTEHPALLPGRFIQFQSEAQVETYGPCRRGTGLPTEVAAELFDMDPEDFWLRAPTDNPERLCTRMQRLHSIIAVVPHCDYVKARTPIVFIDLRPVGLWPQWAPTENGVFHPGKFIQDLQIRVVEGFVITVEGGRRHGVDGELKVQDGETLRVLLQSSGNSPGRERHPTTDDEEPSEDHDDSSSTRDALPDSSDLSGGSPSRGPGPFGPPPPEPVNRPRSRSPRHRTEQNLPAARRLQLADVIPVQTFDLTKQSLTLPRVPESWTTRQAPWPLNWFRPDLTKLPLKPATRKGLEDAISCEDLLARPRASGDLTICLYTDGSADQGQQRSGYAVTILLRLGLGACVAVYGLLTEQLLGNGGSLWPTDAPAALRAEQVAIVAAMLWVLQFRAFTNEVSCKIVFDCMAAGYATDGRWQAPDEFGAQAHLLELFLREQPGLLLSFDHIKGHSGDAWNELSDVAAKEAARGVCPYGAPPTEVSQEFLSTDLSWLAAETRAGVSRALPISTGQLVWDEYQDDGYRLTAEQLVPVTPATSARQGHSYPDFYVKAGTLNVQGYGGLCPYIERQLDEADFNIVMFQETKAPPGIVRTKRYLRLGTESLSRWGVAIWVHRTKGLLRIGDRPLLVDEHDITVVIENTRLLILHVRAAGVSVFLVSAHCPYEAKNGEWTEYLGELEKSLRCIKGADLVLLGVDLNGRIPCGVAGTTGDRTVGPPDAIGRRFVQILAKYRLWAPATFSHLHQGEDHTFVHHTGSQHRIDYLIIGGGAACLRAESFVCEEFDTGAPREDHRLAGVSIHGACRAFKPRAALYRPTFDRGKIMSAEGKRILEQACEEFVQPDWSMSPDQHYQVIQQMLQDTLQQHFLLDRASARATFMPAEVWQLREARQRLKRLTRGRITLWDDLVAWAFRQLHDGKDRGMTNLVAKQGLLYQLSAAAIRFASTRIKRGLAKARQNFLRTVLLEGHQGSSQVLRRTKKAGLGGKATQNRCRPLPALLSPATGAPIGDRAGHDQVWLEHFGAQEQGTVLPTSTFIEEAAQPIPCDEVEWSLSYLPSQAEVQSLLRAVPRGKAAGLDNVPGEVLASAHAGLAPILHTLYTKAMVLSKQPTQWRGGILFEAYKNAGPASDVENFRSLFVSSTVGKCYHKLVKSKVQDRTQCSLHPLHCGPRQRAPVLFPELYILSHVRRCCRQGLNYAILYLDTKSAYYSIARELVTGDIRRDSTVIEIFRRFHLGPAELQELMQLVTSGGAMAAADVPPALRQTIRDLHHATWFTTRYADGTQVCQTLKGSRPGESFADTVFAFIYSKILCSIYEAATAEDLAFTLPFDPETGPFGTGEGSSDQPSWDATWADDSAFPTAARDGDELLRKTCRLAAVVLGTCQADGLIPNMKAGKTSLMIGLRGKGSLRVKRRYFSGGSPVLKIDELGEEVHVVPHYKHLGGYLDTKNSMMMEARHRIALATQAYDSAGKLLLNRRDLDMPVRMGIFNSVVTASLFNIALWIEGGKAWCALDSAYSRLVRRLLCTTIRGERLFRVPTPLAHAASGCWKLALVARRARLSLLASLAASGPDLLWAALQTEGGWLRQVCEDLRWFVEGDSDGWPLVHGAAWPQWRTILRERPGCFKRRVNRKLKAAHVATCDQDLVMVCHWAMYRALQSDDSATTTTSVWKCWACDVIFSSKAKLGVHLFKTHQRIAEYRHFQNGTCCEACGKQFWSGGRLAAHLRASVSCVRTLRRRRRVVEAVQPGFGSRARRKDDAASYTMSAPESQRPPLECTEEERWFGPQKQLYETVCEAAFEVSDGATFKGKILEAVKQFPVYPAEISEVFDAVTAEIAELNRDPDDRPWAPALAEAMQSACREMIAETQSETTTAAGREAGSGYDEFRLQYNTIDWSEQIGRRHSLHGTRARSLFILTDLWEAEWRKVREELAYSAVLDEPIELLPKPLKDAWLTVLEGGEVAIRAPKAFWGHPLAGPFRPMRAEVQPN